MALDPNPRRVIIASGRITETDNSLLPLGTDIFEYLSNGVENIRIQVLGLVTGEVEANENKAVFIVGDIQRYREISAIILD